ncbi:MAG: hypothetical protein WKF47_15800 [Geodermatophilaceae bacterium]
MAAYDTDALVLLRAVHDPGAPPWLRELPSGAAKGDDLYWNGYKVHITETCDTPTPVPAERYLDSGYPSAALVVDSLRRWGITLVSSLLADQSRQARTGAGSDRAGFTIDFDTQQARCPQGKTSTWWSPATQRGTDAIVIKFAADTCRACSTGQPDRAGQRASSMPRSVKYTSSLLSFPFRRTRHTKPSDALGSIEGVCDQLGLLDLVHLPEPRGRGGRARRATRPSIPSDRCFDPGTGDAGTSICHDLLPPAGVRVTVLPDRGQSASGCR